MLQDVLLSFSLVSPHAESHLQIKELSNSKAPDLLNLIYHFGWLCWSESRT